MNDFDPDTYRSEAADLGLTREQENEVLAILWSIMRSFVELGFGVDSVQMLLQEWKEASSEDAPEATGFVSCQTTENRQEAPHPDPSKVGTS